MYISPRLSFLRNIFIYIYILYCCRTQLKLWAVIRLQRFVSKYVRRREKRVHGRIKMMETRERWKKKIEGVNYKPPPPPQKQTTTWKPDAGNRYHKWRKIN